MSSVFLCTPPSIIDLNRLNSDAEGDICTTPVTTTADSSPRVPSHLDTDSTSSIEAQIEPQAPRKTTQATKTPLPASELSPCRHLSSSHQTAVTADQFEHPLEKRRREKGEHLKGLGGWNHLAPSLSLSQPMSQPPSFPLAAKPASSLQLSPGFAFCNLIATRSRAHAPSSIPLPRTAKKKLNLDPSYTEEEQSSPRPLPPHSQGGLYADKCNCKSNVMSAAARIRMVMAARREAAESRD
jgi:hypothetical protein